MWNNRRIWRPLERGVGGMLKEVGKARDGVDRDDMDLLVKECDQALAAACSGLMQTADRAAPELRQYA